MLAFSVSLSGIAIAWSWSHGALLNYGDAAAHLHIARRVFDSHQPRFSELGSVWLPLPHILLLPFVQKYSWWASGTAGILPSALAYIAACLGIYRLARRWIPPIPAALALVFFAANPNLLYLQTTAMTEPLFVCEMIWTTCWLVEWRSGLDLDPPQGHRLLWPIAFVLVAAVFTRYDGWVMAFLAWVAIGMTLARRGLLRIRSYWVASVFVAAAPIAWFLYNSAAFDDWLFFIRGPYSAAAIEARTATPGFPPHPGWHNLWVSLIFYIKTAEMDLAAGKWGTLLLLIAVAGILIAFLANRRRGIAWTLPLLLPVPFYAYSVAYGSVPIFLPVWWPHSYYNLRYGLELLPAFALAIGFAAHPCLGAVRDFKRYGRRANWENATALLLFALLAVNAVEMIKEGPAVYVEGERNIEAHRPYQLEIPPVLRRLLAERPGGVLLMDTSYDPEIVAFTGIPLRQTINESDLGIYRDALNAPAARAALVLAYDGDEIDRAVHEHPDGLTVYRRFSAAFQPSVTLYVSDTSGATTIYTPRRAVVASLKETQ